MTEIDPNLWASLAREYTGGINAPVTGQGGYLARVNAEENNLEYVSDADLLRTGYDYAIAETAVAHDAGEGWFKVATWPLTIFPLGTSRDITFELFVTFSASYPPDTVIMHGAYSAHVSGGGNDFIINKDESPAVCDEGGSAEVDWAIELPVNKKVTTIDLLETRLSEDGAKLYLYARRHATQDRSIHGHLYLGNS